MMNNNIYNNCKTKISLNKTYIFVVNLLVHTSQLILGHVKLFVSAQIKL